MLSRAFFVSAAVLGDSGKEGDVMDEKQNANVVDAHVANDNGGRLIDPDGSRLIALMREHLAHGSADTRGGPWLYCV